MNPQLHKFITTGERPGTQKELSAVLDSARNLILQTKPTNKMITFPTETQKRETLLEKMTAEYRVKNGMPPAPHTRNPVAAAPPRRNPAARPAAPAASKPVIIHRAKPAPSAPSAPAQKFTTAAEFQTPVRTMTRAEWNKLSASDKGRWISEGGKLA